MPSECVLCGEQQARPLLQRRDRLGQATFTYLACPRCGLIRVSPMPSPEEIAAFYPETYEPHSEVRENWLFRLGRRWGWNRRLRVIRRHLAVHGGSVLDIGCGTGEFLALLQEKGWQVAGLEPGPRAAALARRRLGTDAVQNLPLEQAEFAPWAFDLITLWDVLEHLRDPRAALERVRPWLRPGGVLAVGVPNLSSWDARIFGPHWIGWDAPRHLYLFPEATLRAILLQAGFAVLEARCLYGGYGALLLSLETMLAERSWGRLGRRLHRVISTRPWRYLLWPYYRIAEWAGRGPVRTYLCRPAGPAEAALG